MAKKALVVLCLDLQHLLVGRQTRHDCRHLLVRVYPEAPLLGDAGELDILGVEFLLHDLLERL